MLEYSPGTTQLQCIYCGAANQIADTGQVIEELSYIAQLDELATNQQVQEATVIHCNTCGASSTLKDGVASGDCPFCGQPVVATAIVKKQIKPKSLLPFAIKDAEAKSRFDQWLKSRWFAPSSLKKFAEAGGLKGVYLPAWTYDCKTFTTYIGQRGEHYYDTESYTTMVNGRSERRTRRVQKTRWYSASGSVNNAFDDLLVLADNSLPPKLRGSLSNWDMKSLVPYQDDYLSGFIAETYQVELKDGFEIAKQIMSGEITATIRQDIGGDEQRISSMNPVYSNITFKHILLPAWISAYRFKDKTFHFVVNARNGQVFGERPYSRWKISLFVLSIVLVVLLIILISQG